MVQESEEAATQSVSMVLQPLRQAIGEHVSLPHFDAAALERLSRRLRSELLCLTLMGHQRPWTMKQNTRLLPLSQKISLYDSKSHQVCSLEKYRLCAWNAVH